MYIINWRGFKIPRTPNLYKYGKIIVLLDYGYSHSDIGYHLSCSYSTIQRALKWAYDAEVTDDLKLFVIKKAVIWFNKIFSPGDKDLMISLNKKIDNNNNNDNNNKKKVGN